MGIIPESAGLVQSNIVNSRAPVSKVTIDD